MQLVSLLCCCCTRFRAHWRIKFRPRNFQFSSALCCFIILGQKLSGVQVSTLGLLMVSTLVIQGNWKELLDMLRYKSKPGGTADKSNNQGNRSSQNNLLLGVIPCLGATLLSGLAGAFSQNSLQCIEMPIFTLWRYRSCRQFVYLSHCALIGARVLLWNKIRVVSGNTKFDLIT